MITKMYNVRVFDIDLFEQNKDDIIKFFDDYVPAQAGGPRAGEGHFIYHQLCFLTKGRDLPVTFHNRRGKDGYALVSYIRVSEDEGEGYVFNLRPLLLSFGLSVSSIKAPQRPTQRKTMKQLNDAFIAAKKELDAATEEINLDIRHIKNLLDCNDFAAAMDVLKKLV